MLLTIRSCTRNECFSLVDYAAVILRRSVVLCLEISCMLLSCVWNVESERRLPAKALQVGLCKKYQEREVLTKRFISVALHSKPSYPTSQSLAAEHE